MLNIICRVGHCLQANNAQKKKHGFSKNPTPLEFNLATPNAHHKIALCLCYNMTLS